MDKKRALRFLWVVARWILVWSVWGGLIIGRVATSVFAGLSFFKTVIATEEQNVAAVLSLLVTLTVYATVLNGTKNIHFKLWLATSDNEEEKPEGKSKVST